MATITIQQYEREVREPRIKQLREIADALGIPVTELYDSTSEQAHYEKITDLYYHAVITWSEDDLFSEEESTAIKMHFSDMLIRYKNLIEDTLNHKLSLRRYLESIAQFNNESESPLSTQELIERYLSQELEKDCNSLKTWIDAAPYHFSVAMEKSLDSADTTEQPKDE